MRHGEARRNTSAGARRGKPAISCDRNDPNDLCVPQRAKKVGARNFVVARAQTARQIKQTDRRRETTAFSSTSSTSDAIKKRETRQEVNDTYRDFKLGWRNASGWMLRK